MRYKFLLMLFLALSLLGCAQQEKEGKDTLVIGEIWDIKSVDPARSGTLMREKALVAETLVDIGSDLSLKPGLAVEWERLNDTAWRFYLRENVKFHDGSEMRAEDVKWSIDRALQNPSVKALTLIKAVKVVDDHTIDIITESPNSILPATLAYNKLAIISPNSGMDDAGVVLEPIGTGPLKFVRWDTAEKALYLERFGEYWGKKAEVKHWVIKVIDDPSSRSLAVEKGEVDLTYDVSYGDIERLSKTKGLKVDLYTTLRVYQLNFGSVSDSLYEDARVRKAISLAIDRESIAEKALHGAAEPAYRIVLPQLWWSGEDCSYYNYNPEKAKELLREAGWVDNDGDGILEKDGREFKITIYTYPQRPGLKPMAEAIQAYLQAVGIKAEVKVMDWSAITKFMTKNDMRLAAFHETMVPDPDYYLRRIYHSNGTYNTWDYSNDELDKLLEDGLKTSDTEKRKTIYVQIQKIACEDMPIIHVAFYKVPVVYRDYIKDVKFNPAAHDLWLYQGIRIEK